MIWVSGFRVALFKKVTGIIRATVRVYFWGFRMIRLLARSLKFRV